jgi:hypothetical protein
MIRRARMFAIAVASAAIVHAIAGRHLGAVDPIGSLLGRGDAGVVIAAIGVAGARLFLFFVAPGWALHIAVRALLRRAAYVPPK